MQDVSIDEVWGVGRRLSVRLNQDGIFTVADLKNTNPETIRSRYNVLLQKTVLELRGIACIELEDQAQNKTADSLFA